MAINPRWVLLTHLHGAGCELTRVDSDLLGWSNTETHGRNPGPRLSAPLPHLIMFLPYQTRDLRIPNLFGMGSTHRTRALPLVLTRASAPVSSSGCHSLVVVDVMTFALTFLIARQYHFSNCRAYPIVWQI